MTIRVGLLAAVGLLAVSSTVVAQNSRPPVGPNQPIMPRVPVLQRRAPPQQAPFQLTPQEQAYLDQVLQDWEKQGRGVRDFTCRFVRWEYQVGFGQNDPNKPRHTDEGELRYGAPDRGMFHMLRTEKNGKMVKLSPQRAEHWVCDGKSVFEFDYVKKELIQHKLPPEMQGKAITDGPLPFLFGSEAAKLKVRYFMRIITPREKLEKQIWLEAYPRFARDAANFSRATLILNQADLMPHALQIHLPNNQSRTAYEFYDIKTNDPLSFLKGNPFRPITPIGWRRSVQDSRQQQAQRPPNAGRR